MKGEEFFFQGMMRRKMERRIKQGVELKMSEVSNG